MRIAIIGLGYVGLPLAVAFAEHYPTVGFDINRKRIGELQKGLDYTQEMDPCRLQAALSRRKRLDIDRRQRAVK